VNTAYAFFAFFIFRACLYAVPMSWFIDGSSADHRAHAESHRTAALPAVLRRVKLLAKEPIRGRECSAR